MGGALQEMVRFEKCKSCKCVMSHRVMSNCIQSQKKLQTHNHKFCQGRSMFSSERLKLSNSMNEIPETLKLIFFNRSCEQSRSSADQPAFNALLRTNQIVPLRTECIPEEMQG